MKTNGTILKVFGRVSATMLMLAMITAAAFATLGDGKSTNTKPAKKSLLSSKTSLKPGTFSLSSGYNFRGTQVFSSSNSNYTINLNTIATYQTGRVSYIVPLKKKLLVENVKIDIGNRQFRRN